MAMKSAREKQSHQPRQRDLESIPKSIGGFALAQAQADPIANKFAATFGFVRRRT
jgi:hypothetical protein